jgi:uncharacterized protein
MKHIELLFSPELADFFRIESRVLYPLVRKASIKDIIESQGIPHTEVGEIVIKEIQANFEFIPVPGQQINVKSVQAPLDITRPSILRPRTFRDIRFVVDLNVGKLAPLLRMMGYDTVFDHQLTDKDVALLAYSQQRVVLSRDRSLLKRALIEYGRLVRSQEPENQLKEIKTFFNLNCEHMFSRCLRCNLVLEDVEKERIMHRLEPKTKKYFNRFSLCPGCDRIYWPGSHWEKMNQLVKIAGIC